VLGVPCCLQRQGQKAKTGTQQELPAGFYRLRWPAGWLSLNLGMSRKVLHAECQDSFWYCLGLRQTILLFPVFH